uniref:Uncharacterized protein n=1 Tax=viral metagenome TaxID=1070528 RepID=A0A6C0HGH2_9ZZZZ
MSFEETIKQWVSIDNQLKVLSDRTKELREKKNNMEDAIMTHVVTHKLTNAVVNISDGKLKFVTVKQTAPLTLKFVEDRLSKCIKSEEQVKQIMNFIKDSRESKNVPDIKRYYSTN